MTAPNTNDNRRLGPLTVQCGQRWKACLISARMPSQPFAAAIFRSIWTAAVRSRADFSGTSNGEPYAHHKD